MRTIIADSALLPVLPTQPAIYVRWQLLHTTAAPAKKPLDVIYVHGATFPSSLSVFFEFDERSWANVLNDAGFNVWAFDFAGYGKSGHYDTSEDAGPLGRVNTTAPQLQRVIDFVRSKNEGRDVALIAHSWGSIVALRVASQTPNYISHLVLFAPIAARDDKIVAPKLPPLRPLSALEQYRRFIEDVPRGHAPVLLDRHFERWSEAFLASDATNVTRTPRSVMVPTGPIIDLITTWNGETLYPAQRITQPTLIVRGAWDSLSTNADARTLLKSIPATIKRDVIIPKGTHLMHLEESRSKLYDEVNQFLKAPLP